MERHFAPTSEEGKVHREDEAGAAFADVTTQDFGVEPHPDADDGKSVGLLGTTICFTPEHSPLSSPNLEGVRGELSNIGSLSESIDYIGDLLAYASGSGTDGASSKLRSSAMQIASSLDGRSTSDYEMLDGISSKGTLEVEDLSVDEESIREENFGSPIADKTESPLEMFGTLPGGEHQDETLILDGIRAGREPSENGNSPVSSHNFDDHALTPFCKLLKFWEGRSSFTNMVMGQTIGTETTQVANSEESTSERGTLLSDTLVDESVSSAFAKVNGALILIGASILSFIASASALVRIVLGGSIVYILNIAKTTFGQIWLRNMTGGTRTENITEADSPQDEVNKAAINAENSPGLARTNLSKLFFLEALKETTFARTLVESVRRSESEEHERSSIDYNVAILDQRETAILKTINDEVTAGIVTKCRRVIPSLNFEASGFAIAASSSIITCMTLQYVVDLLCKSMEIPSFEEYNLYCVCTNKSSFVSIPFWELVLSPIFVEEEYHVFNDASDEMMPRSCLSTIVIVSITTLLFYAFLFMSATAFPTTKPKAVDKVLTGIWSEEEHRQFLEGYNVHGSHWKLVSAFVPTRNHAQVRTHGSYWLKVHSPVRMKKTRKQDPIFGSSSPASSSKSTPRRSNQIKVTPKGILRDKNQNQTHNYATPKNERYTANMHGYKSDPTKRVNFVAP
ncbi:hypothetical protein ACHAXA_004222 [Cyclostephanos tholiformis]|uniref:Myb-like domain-containing protein n=1 Tax=Cyclostephanos tholiformis TaxID=382380 RepID=A0ABD3R3U3_9STRA